MIFALFIIIYIIIFILSYIALTKVLKVNGLFKQGLFIFFYLIFLFNSLILFFYLKDSNFKLELSKIQVFLDEKIDSQINSVNASLSEIPKEKDFLLYDSFFVYKDEQVKEKFPSYAEAISYAKKIQGADVFYNDLNQRVWSSSIKLPIKIILDAPLVSQLPELPRGCEVASLTMMLNYAGIYEANKMQLAEEVRKDPTPYSKIDDKIYFGDPNEGFVGDMYTLDNPGYGVYHEPIKELAELYLPNKVINMTGVEFDTVLYHISNGNPVWVISNVTFAELPPNAFQTWITPNGKIDITYRLHAVLVTGFDEEYVYFNDPLQNAKNRKTLRENFRAAWEQMGKQAITYIK
ncbi:C39 family peptidase [Anaerobacillus sp. MEB173]|uniref:C39 family peptidase n=1 Tax=Anaerobacillus sp. MEB173 TaxID=3383345 RepID=UPI003F92735B